MLFHASISADNPEHVARVIAELWRGEMMPFLPHPGAYMAWSGDERGTELEIFPRGPEEFPSPGKMTVRKNPSPSQYSECHLAMWTRLSFEEVLGPSPNARAGWRNVVTVAGFSTLSSSGSKTSYFSSCCLTPSRSATSRK
jgi:hypothetical protein